MNFIEKIVSAARSTPAAEAVTHTTDAPDQRADQPPEQGNPTAEATTHQPDQSTFPTTPEELTQLLDAKKEEWAAAQKAEEAERLRYLPEKERQQQEQLAKDKELSNLKAELAKRDMQGKVIAKREEKRLPASIGELVQYGDESATMKSLDKVCGIIETMVQDGINLRLRGKTPEGLGMAAQHENAITDPFARAFIDTSKK